MAALALLAPLDRRLRTDAVRALTETTLAARPMLVRLPARDVHRDSRPLQTAVDDIRRRTGAEVAAVDARGRVIAASEARRGDRYPDVVEAVADDRVVAGIVQSGEGAEARVAVTVRRRNDPYGLSLRRPLTTLERDGARRRRARRGR